MLSDIRMACRTLARRRVFSASTSLMLAVAIAGVLVVDAVADAVLFRSYPFPQPDRLVVIYARDQSPSANPAAQRGAAGAQEVGLSIPDLDDFRRLSRTLSGFAAITPFGANLTGTHTPVRVRGASVSSNFFDVVGALMAFGAGFSISDNAIGGNRAVILTHAFWTRQLGGDAAAVGRDLLLNGLPHRIAGVLDPRFVPLTGDHYDVYRAATPAAATADRATRFWPAIARLHGSDPDAARAELNIMASDLARKYPDTNRNFGVAVHRLSDLTPRDVRLALLFQLAAVALLAIVTCANVANLQIAHAAARSSEVSIRITLGASRWRLMRQSAIEGLVLGMVAGVAGFLLSIWGLDVMKGVAPPMPRLDSAVIGGRAAMFCAMAAAGIGLILGFAPWSRMRRHASVGDGAARVVGSRRRAIRCAATTAW
jgi:putative ABC transport system permease protein